MHLRFKLVLHRSGLKTFGDTQLFMRHNNAVVSFLMDGLESAMLKYGI